MHRCRVVVRQWGEKEEEDDDDDGNSNNNDTASQIKLLSLCRLKSMLCVDT